MSDVSRYCVECERLSRELSQSTERVSDYSNQVRILKDALSYYAGMPMHTSRGEYEYDSGSFEEDRGKRARRTLAELSARQAEDTTHQERKLDVTVTPGWACSFCGARMAEGQTHFCQKQQAVYAQAEPTAQKHAPLGCVHLRPVGQPCPHCMGMGIGSVKASQGVVEFSPPSCELGHAWRPMAVGGGSVCGRCGAELTATSNE